SDGIEGHEYAEHLLDLARVLNRRGQSWSAALTMTRPSTIERRFSAMLNPGLNRYPVTRSASFFMAFLGLAVAVLLRAVSTASPIHSIAEKPLLPALEKTVAPANTEPEQAPITVPAAIKSESARVAAKQAPVEFVASARSMLAQAPQLGSSQGRRGSAL